MHREPLRPGAVHTVYGLHRRPRGWQLGVLALAACGGSSEPLAEDPTGIHLDPHGDTDQPRLDLGGGPSPEPEPVVLAEPPPPPISGGTLLLSHEGTVLVAADPDRDHVYVVDIRSQQRLHAIELEPGSEPGRLVEDPTGVVHVALRRSGEVATVDIDTGELLAVREACANPRGLAVDPGDGSVLVACAEGILARLRPDDTGERLDVGIELRDVVDPGPPLRVSTFREAQVLTLDDTGTIIAQQTPPAVWVRFEQFVTPDEPEPEPELEPDDVMTPNTARRTWRTADGGWLMLHQAGSTVARRPQAGGYGGGDGVCIPLQTTVITHGLPGSTTPEAWPLRHIAPAFDAAVTADLSLAAVVGGINGDWAIMFASDELQPRTVLESPCRADHQVELPGEPTSVVFDDDGLAWVQLREPAALVLVDPEDDAVVANVALAERSVRDTGHALFHRPTLGMVACVSCHPEGREDGRVWEFSGLGLRRTQALDIGLEGGEPFHWRGELADIAAVVKDTFEGRMAGTELHEDHVAALERWLFALPPLAVAVPDDMAASERGRERFEALGCASCHTGPRLTHDGTVPMGPYGLLQVPSLLGVVFRAPYMHDGRTPDLEAAVVDMLRLTVPSAETSTRERADLVAYLESLGSG